MIEEVKINQTFDIKRQNLGELALDTALEIERLIAGLQSETTNIVNFISVISSSLTPRPNTGGLQHLVDPTVVPLYSRAASTVSSHSLSTVQELLSWISQFNEPKGRLEAFRDFCLAIHRELIAEEVFDQNEINRPKGERAEYGGFALTY